MPDPSSNGALQVPDLWGAWMNLWFAPRTLTQSILPGWTWAPELTINEGNSSAPATEAEVVRHHSYGRQLGRLADAVQVLIDERGERPGPPALDAFSRMKHEIDQLKLDAAAARVGQVVADLEALRAAGSPDYARLRDHLRDALGPY
jgi:hypothetical protein